MGHNVAPDDKTILRWYQMIRYPKGVSIEEGEDWYLNVHAKEVMQQPGSDQILQHQNYPATGSSITWMA